MKRLPILLAAMALLCALTACGKTEAPDTSPQNTPAPQSDTQSPGSSSPSDDRNTSDEDSSSEILVAYFSATGNTESVAGAIADATGGDLFEITPADPYTSADLNWTDENSRVVYEYENPEERDVALAQEIPADWADYDVVFLGYPIWWGIAAWPVSSFVEANDFAGKTVIPFCTSSSSGLGQSGDLLADLAGNGTWLEGQRFRGGASEADVAAWVESLNLA